MICVSIATKNVDQCLEMIREEELAEIRLDLTEFDAGAIKKVFNQKVKLIATFRPGKMDESKRLELLKQAIQSGASYIDIEYEAEVKYRKELVGFSKKHGCEVIISYHNFNETPSRNELERVVSDCYLYGADVAKIATQVNEKKDIANLLSLYNTSKRTVVLGMGEKGKITRVLAPMVGAEFTFAAPDNGTVTAPGQLKKSELVRIQNQLENI